MYFIFYGPTCLKKKENIIIIKPPLEHATLLSPLLSSSKSENRFAIEECLIGKPNSTLLDMGLVPRTPRIVLNDLQTYHVRSEVLEKVGESLVQPGIGPGLRAHFVTEPHMDVLVADDPADILLGGCCCHSVCDKESHFSGR